MCNTGHMGVHQSLLIAVALLGLIAARPQRIRRDTDIVGGDVHPDSHQCTDDCKGMADGTYQSCDSCQSYVACLDGQVKESMSCPPGLIWDDSEKNCEMASTTCHTDEVLSFMVTDGSDEDSGNYSTVSDDEDLPTYLNLKFAMKQKDIHLNLTKNPHIDVNFPTIMAKNGRTTTTQPSKKERFAVYMDKASQSSFIVKMKQSFDGRLMRHYEGMFNMDDEAYFVMPTPQPGTKSHDILKRSVENVASGDAYMARKIRPLRSDVEIDNSTMREQMKQMTDEEEKVLAIAQDLPQGKQIYRVDILLFIDYAIYNKWYGLSKKQTVRERSEEAVENIRFYFAHLMNGVDLRYNSIEHSELEVYFKLNGIYIAETPSDSPWTEYNRPHSVFHTDAYDSLDAFELWLNRSKDVLPPFDLATLFTGYHLYSGRRADGSFRTIGGLADIKGACSYVPVWYGASINFDNGLYATTQTATHEIGHNLGSFHDGDYRYAPTCSGQDRYIMASAPGTLTDQTYKNAFKFSPCSIRSIRDYLMFLTIEKRNCLTVGEDQVAVRVNTSVLLGQVFTPDHQCQQIFGQQSYYCAGGDLDQKICREMWCYNPASDRCSISAEQRSADGTTCGNKKWCSGGDCVYNALAPEAPESCIYGDYKERFQPLNLNCAQLLQRQPFLCYRPDYSIKCCETCAQIQRHNTSGCDYGDHEQSCKTVESHFCYQKAKRESCCEECPKRAIGPQGCEYGDSATWCRTQITSGYSCYGQNITCCQSCARFKINLPNCEYGDKVSWCDRIGSSQCYTENYRSRCCQKCHSIQNTNDPQCNYGDRRSGCRPSDCQYSHNIQACCHTCRANRTVVVKTTTTTAKPTTSTTARSTTTTQKITSATCPNGDTASNCDILITRPGSCYDHSNICCQTCAKYITTISGCRYGDKYSWCENYVTKYQDTCKRLDISSNCCKICSKLQSPTTTTTSTSTTTTSTTTTTTQATPTAKTTQIGCNSPDKADWCTGYVQKYPTSCGTDPSVMSNCCESCRSVHITSATTVSSSSPTLSTQPVLNECRGDKASWCKDYVGKYPSTCSLDQSVQENCCTSCQNVQSITTTQTTDPVLKECPNSQLEPLWCGSHIANNPGNCYSESFMTTCCSYCAKYRKDHQENPKSCQYGDEFSWCKGGNHCSEKDRQSCCKSCANRS